MGLNLPFYYTLTSAIITVSDRIAQSNQEINSLHSDKGPQAL